MSAKKEKELRRQLAACEALLGQHEGMMALHKQTADKLDEHQKCLGENLKILQCYLRRIEDLEKNVKRNTEWRRECIERRMERAVQIRRIRKMFRIVGAVLSVFWLGVCGGIERGHLQLLPGMILMVGFGAMAAICFCKGGAFDA